MPKNTARTIIAANRSRPEMSLRSGLFSDFIWQSQVEQI
jgi:hypothetical protein